MYLTEESNTKVPVFFFVQAVVGAGQKEAIQAKNRTCQCNEDVPLFL